MKPYKQPGSENWYYRFRIDGREYRGSTGTSNYRKAEEFMREKYVDLKRTAPAERLGSLEPTLGKMRERDVARAVRLKRSEAYIVTLRRYFSVFSEFFGNKRAITDADLEAYVKWRESVAAGQTIMRELTVLKRSLTTAYALKEVASIPVLWPKLAGEDKDEHLQGHYYSAAELRRWLGELWGPAYDIAVVALLTGLRYGELYKLQPDWVVPADKDLKIAGILIVPAWAAKRRQSRQVPLSKAAYDAVLRAAPFKSYHRGAFNQAAKRAKLSRGMMHLRDCRVAFANAADTLHDPRTVDLVMGHAGGIPGRYQRLYAERIAPVAIAVTKWFGKLPPPRKSRRLPG